MKMNIKIYNAKIETTPYIFNSWECAEEQFDFNRDYCLVGEGEVDFKFGEDKGDYLESLFIALNSPRPQEFIKEDIANLDKFKYKGHSLSVSDIVCFVDDNEYYYVDPVGFVKIKELCK